MTQQVKFADDVAQRIINVTEAIAIQHGVTPEDMRAFAIQTLGGAAVAASGDARTANNSTRQAYRILGETEKAQVDSLKELGAMFIGLCHEIGGTDPDGDRAGSRNLSLAITHMEDAVMRAVRHVTV